MDFKTFNEVVEKQVQECYTVLGVKNKEYASADDRFHNFKRAAGLTGKTPIQALAGMMLKHTVSVYDLCEQEDSPSDDIWKEKITDHINYLLLLRALVVESMSKEEN